MGEKQITAYSSIVRNRQGFITRKLRYVVYESTLPSMCHLGYLPLSYTRAALCMVVKNFKIYRLLFNQQRILVLHKVINTCNVVSGIQRFNIANDLTITEQERYSDA